MKTALPTGMQLRWHALHDREKNLVRGAAMFLGLVLVGWWGCAMPLNMLRQAEAQRPGLDAQWRRMQSLQAEAQALQGQAKVSAEDASRALQASASQRLGASAQLSILGRRATVTLRGTPADALAAWLADARANAHAVPDEARLVRSTSGAAGIAAWDGTLVLDLPAP
jgi:general secretion pathway protein M